jgi:hypothetical protein
MLIDPKFAEQPDSTLGKILQVIANERGTNPIRIGQGLYQIGHWNFVDLLEGKWGSYPGLPGDHNAYGVCDSPDQFMKVLGPVLAIGPRQYVVSFVQLKKADEPSEGGWRWHKWGPYIGEQDPQCEYLYDEPVIEEVWTYHIYEKMS